MSDSLAYQKEFMGLPGLRGSRTIRYALTTKWWEDKPLYGVRVTEIEQNRIISDESCLFTEAQEWAQQLLTFLYENAIPAEHCVSVISDLCAADSTLWEDDDGKDPNPTAHCG